MGRVAAAPAHPAARRRVYRSTRSERQLLDHFWARCREDADRLELLQWLSVIAVQRPKRWRPADVRAAFVPRPYPREGCFACFRRDRKMAWHHIIAIDHGGSNDIWNQVPVCHVCHARIHPWLADETDLGSWTSIADVVKAFCEGKV